MVRQMSSSPSEVPNPSTGQPAAAPGVLSALRGLRTAPELSEDERQMLRAELNGVMVACPWFTIGVMAPTAAMAIATLRRYESALGWPSLVSNEASDDPIPGPAFLKGNQRSGSFLLRSEEGLGEGVLISGQHPEDASLTDTWGPLPLDLF